MAQHFNQLLKRILNDPYAKMTDLCMLSERERDLLLSPIKLCKDAPGIETIHQLFDKQVGSNGNNIALVCGDCKLSYSELNELSDQLANMLLEKGVKSQSNIGVCFERSENLIISLIAILKLGCAYVPLDPEFPEQRVTYILNDADVNIVICHKNYKHKFANKGIDSVDFDLELLSGCSPKFSEKCPNLEGRMLANIMYTSGSTGKPKGVMVDHLNVIRLIHNESSVDISNRDVVVYCANPAFDASTWEIWATLLNGARLLIINQKTLLNPVLLEQILIEEKATVLQLTAGLFNQYASAYGAIFSRLRYVLFGGDKPDLNAVSYVFKNHKPDHLIHTYGPTETIAFTTTYEVNEDVLKTGYVPIGKMMENTQGYVLDSAMKLVPIGAIGELYIAGAGVTQGYLNQSRLTAESFVNNPFGEGKLYKTGDKVRYLFNGNMVFIGREDDQVKIRGFRIELGEIEHKLANHPGIDSSFVLVKQDSIGEKTLIAYIKQDLTREKIHNEQLLFKSLKDYLTSSLPDFMIPRDWVEIEDWPLTSNGKIDKNALPLPSIVDSACFSIPNSESEKKLVKIWSDLLNIPSNDLGGHSLLCVRMVIEVQRTFSLVNYPIDIKDIFEANELNRLAQRIEHSVIQEQKFALSMRVEQMSCLEEGEI